MENESTLSCRRIPSDVRRCSALKAGNITPHPSLCLHRVMPFRREQNGGGGSITLGKPDTRHLSQVIEANIHIHKAR